MIIHLVVNKEVNIDSVYESVDSNILNTLAAVTDGEDAKKVLSSFAHFSAVVLSQIEPVERNNLAAHLFAYITYIMGTVDAGDNSDQPTAH